MLYMANIHIPTQKLQEENGAWKKDTEQQLF